MVILTNFKFWIVKKGHEIKHSTHQLYSAYTSANYGIKDSLRMLHNHLWNKKISSTRVQHKVGSRDEKQWSPYIKGQWITKMLADDTWCTITGMDEMKWMRWVWRNNVMKLVMGKRGQIMRKPTQTPFDPPRNPHGVTEMWTWDRMQVTVVPEWRGF